MLGFGKGDLSARTGVAVPALRVLKRLQMAEIQVDSDLDSHSGFGLRDRIELADTELADSDLKVRCTQ